MAEKQIFKAISSDTLEVVEFEIEVPDKIINTTKEKRSEEQRESAREKILHGLKKFFLTLLWPFIFARRHWKTVLAAVILSLIGGAVGFYWAHINDIENLEESARKAYYNNDFEETLKLSDTALDRLQKWIVVQDDYNFEFWFLKGNAFLELKRYEEAIQYYDHVLGVNPEDFDLKIKGVVEDKQDLARKGKEKAEKAIEERKKEEEFQKYYYLGYTAFENSLYRESVENYSRALAINPENVSALIGRCAGFIWLKKYDEAMKDCNKALVNDPDNAIALTNICLIFEHEENYTEALRCSDKVSAICQKRKCSDQTIKKFNEIKEYSKKKIAEKEKERQAEEKRKQEEFERHHQEEEIRKQAVRVKWDEAARLQSKGYSFLKSGKYRKAIGFFDQALLADSDNVFAMFNKGVALYQLGKYDEAIKIFDEAVSAHHRCKSTVWPSQRSDCFDEDEIMKAKDNTVRRISEIEEEKELAERRAEETRIKAEEKAEKRKAEAEKRRVEEEEQKKREEDARGWREMREGAERIAKWQIDSKLPILIERYGSSIGETGDGHKLGQICRERCQQDIKVEGEKCRDRATAGMDPLDPSYDYQRWIAPCYSIETKPNTLNCQCAEDYRKILDISKRYNY